MPHEKKPRKPRLPRAPKDPSLRNKMYTYRLSPTRKQVGTLEWILRRSKELYYPVSIPFYAVGNAASRLPFGSSD